LPLFVSDIKKGHLTLAPFVIKKFIISRWLRLIARPKGENPLVLSRLISAPSLIKALIFSSHHS